MNGSDGSGSRDRHGGAAIPRLLPVVATGQSGLPLRPGQANRALPLPSSTFVGREHAVEDVARRLQASRLVTLSGPGGVGKTSLAVEVAADASYGGHPVVFVGLGALSGPPSVLQAVATALGVPGNPTGALAHAVVAHLAGERLLVVLDNCEHLRAACASTVESLLAACGGLRILATSRERLGARDEVVWPVPPLSLPDPLPAAFPGRARAALPEVFACSEAVQLFCERAAELQPGFLPTAGNAEAIIEICRRLDGNPLAIELAAARVVALPPEEIAARLDDRFSLLEGRASTAPARQQTLRATLDWSYGLLTSPEQALLRRLSVFPGSFCLAAAEEVCGGADVDPPQVLTLLTGLVEKSLVVSEATGATARFRLLETVRAYGAERLAEVGRTGVLAERLSACCLALVEGGPGEGGTAHADGQRLARLEAEQDNLVAAVERALAEGKPELALRLVSGQMRLWERRGRFTEARQSVERVLAASDDAPRPLRAAALHDAGFAALMVGDLDVARRHLRSSLALAGTGAHPRPSVRTCTLLGFASTFGDDVAGVEDLEQSVTEVRAVGDDADLADVLVACGYARMFRGDPGAARHHFEGARQAARRAGDESLLATSLVSLGAAELAQGDDEAAEGHLHEGIVLVAATGDTHRELVAMTSLAELAWRRGGHDEAGKRFEECLERARAMGAPHPLARSLLGLGQVRLDDGEPGRAQALFEEAGEVAQRAGLAHLVALALVGASQAASALGDGARARAHLEDALALARRRHDQVGQALALQAWTQVSRHEGEVAIAASRCRQALVLHARIGDPAATASSLEMLGSLVAAEDDCHLAARLLGAADALRECHGCPRPTAQQAEHQATVEAVRRVLGDEPLATEWRQGRAWSTHAAVASAQRWRSRRVQPLTAWEALTPAERRVATLAAQGLSSRAIAHELVVSRRTVETHLQHIYPKLGIRSRKQLPSFVRNATDEPT